MERRGKTHEVAVDVARVIVARCHANFLGKGGEFLDERVLSIARKDGQVDRAGLDAVALFLQRFEQAANSRVRVLDVVDGVLAVLAHGEAEVEFHLRVGLGVEEVAAGVDGNFVEQVRERNGLTRALGHTHDLAVAHELDELHQHDVETVRAVEAQRVHRALHAGHVTVMVSAPDVNDLVEVTHGELVAVIGNVAGKVGVEAVGAAQNVVL